MYSQGTHVDERVKFLDPAVSGRLIPCVRREPRTENHQEVSASVFSNWLASVDEHERRSPANIYACEAMKSSDKGVS